jgi:hypothetical protein
MQKPTGHGDGNWSNMKDLLYQNCSNNFWDEVVLFMDTFVFFRDEIIK